MYGSIYYIQRNTAVGLFIMPHHNNSASSKHPAPDWHTLSGLLASAWVPTRTDLRALGTEPGCLNRRRPAGVTKHPDSIDKENTREIEIPQKKNTNTNTNTNTSNQDRESNNDERILGSA